MTRGFRLGLRARLALALIAIAALTVGLSMLFSTVGLNGRFAAAAGERLTGQALHTADASAGVYSSAGGRWTTAAIGTLGHVAAAGGIRLQLVDPAGKLIGTSGPRVSAAVPHVSAEVMVDGRVIAHLAITPLNGQLLSPEETRLKHLVDVLHLYAGIASVVVALCLAVFLAGTLSAPLRRIRAGAERLSQDELTTRVAPGGDDEIQAVGLALNRLAETLQQEEAHRKENVADLAHELRTPVTGLLSRIEAAQDGVMGDAVANLDAMHDEAIRLSRLLDDLRNLSDAERPGLLVEKRPLDLAVLVRRQVELATPASAAKNIDLHADLQPARVEGDAARLDQVAANLLSNALQYTPANQSVSVGVREEDGSAVLEVSDTGIGIAAEDLPHVFTRFWRGEKSRSRNRGGAGIGLAIVRELVRAHDGSVVVESTPDKGSRFVVRLPLCDVPGVHGGRELSD